ncbi:ADGRL3 [Acanthosepion pharaonis]|uniref:ADGRL3 n=1 Tax=Acanthosepion pharaonis TaxID=158019 RepID=A0A812EBN4_ACAPH|nr:ADGRL3 [Sepia pharaonis]
MVFSLIILSSLFYQLSLHFCSWYSLLILFFSFINCLFTFCLWYSLFDSCFILFYQLSLPFLLMILSFGFLLSSLLLTVSSLFAHGTLFWILDFFSFINCLFTFCLWYSLLDSCFLLFYQLSLHILLMVFSFGFLLSSLLSTVSSLFAYGTLFWSLVFSLLSTVSSLFAYYGILFFDSCSFFSSRFLLSFINYLFTFCLWYSLLILLSSLLSTVSSHGTLFLLFMSLLF